MSRLLWDPLPESWPTTPERPRNPLRALIASMREVASVPTQESVDRRVRRGAAQAIVREAHQRTLAEQDIERRGPEAFAQAWRRRLADLLSLETVDDVTAWSQITTADLDTELAWQLYEAASRERLDTIARATVQPSRPGGVRADHPPAAYFEFAIAASGDAEELGHVQYGICEPCGAGLLQKIGFPTDWQYCGLGTLALRELEARHPHVTWRTTGQYSHAKGFYDTFRQGSGSPWTPEQSPCPHL
jgi:hypothetical protein